MPRVQRLQVTTTTTLIVLLLSFAATLHLWTTGSASAFYGAMTSDRFAVFFDAIILLAAALGALVLIAGLTMRRATSRH